jgi:hypothetical protein
VIPGSKRSVVAEANDLKPRSVRVFRYTACSPHQPVLAVSLCWVPPNPTVRHAGKKLFSRPSGGDLDRSVRPARFAAPRCATARTRAAKRADATAGQQVRRAPVSRAASEPSSSEPSSRELTLSRDSSHAARHMRAGRQQPAAARRLPQAAGGLHRRE